MAEAREIIARYFRSAGGELLLGGIPVSQLAASYGTPLFVYDRQVLERKFEMLRGALPPEFAICYSIKANPNQQLLSFFLGKGCGLEIASAGEFHQALHAGCDPARIIFAGPGKTETELETVLAKGIGEIHAESALEIARIASISRRLGVRAQVALRINPGAEVQGGAMRMGGKPAPFGIDEECLDAALETLLAQPAIVFRGIHLFTGTQILDHAVLVAQYRRGIEIAARAVDRVGHPLHTIDFGGGLGIPYFAHESELEMDPLRVELAALRADLRRDPRFAGTQLVVEPGRYLVGEAGVYLSRVIDVKTSRGKKFAIVDGGMHHHLAASGNLGQTIKRNYPIVLANKLAAAPVETVDVVGPLCTPLDVLARNASLPVAEVGDLIAVFQSGAYARAASPLGFLSHPTPPEVWVEAGRDWLIRRRGQIDDYLGDQIPPSAR
jgi:diaminopimelate decarboxylase